MLLPDENPFMTAHKPVEDGFPFVVETDSLADSMGLRLPNRSLYLLQGKVGAGKSLIAQRLIHGMVQNGVKVLVITTELTTRGWIEQMESIGYGMTDAIREGRVMVLSRYGTVADGRHTARGAQQSSHPGSRRHRARFRQLPHARGGHQSRPLCSDSTTPENRFRRALLHAVRRP